MDELWWTIFPVAEAVWVVSLSVYIVLERRSAHATLAWILALSFLPVIGLLAYLGNCSSRYLWGPGFPDIREVR